MRMAGCEGNGGVAVIEKEVAARPNAMIHNCGQHAEVSRLK